MQSVMPYNEWKRSTMRGREEEVLLQEYLAITSSHTANTVMLYKTEPKYSCNSTASSLPRMVLRFHLLYGMTL